MRTDFIKKKIFYIKDLFIYAFIAVFTVMLFLAVLLQPKNALDGFKIEIDGTTVFTYNFNTKKDFILEEYSSLIFLDSLSKTVTVNFLDGTKNVIGFDAEKKEVFMLDTTCSVSKTCLSFPKICDDKSSIYCAPHKLSVKSLNYTLGDTPVSGA